MLIDCFPFFNELDILDLRLHELDSIVDKFILVEANKTQSLLDKPFYFDENKEKFAKFLNKIIHVKLIDCPNNNHNLWSMENFQRNSVIKGLSQLDITTDDRIMISDLDEIPRAEAIVAARQSDLWNLPVFTLDIDFFVYFLNLKAKNKIWPGTAIFKPELLTKYSIQNIKDGKNDYPKLSNAGWHFSWLGGYAKIIEKAKSCIEPYDKRLIPDENTFKIYFDEYIKNPNKKFIHIENLNIIGIDLEIIKDYKYPDYINNNPDIYQKYFYEH
jgi:beta-1,4-mannosyl-glycoprotein beta-1,4-N-acetylglucosaminyltransferase